VSGVRRPDLLRPSRTLALLTGLLTCGWAEDTVLLQDALLRPGERMAVIDTAHLHVLMPAAQAELLRPQIARAEVIFTAMAAEADYHPDGRLTVVLDDDTDDHNGFSTVVPRPLVNVQLASAQPQATIFAGAGVFERTFIHELTHHFSNDRQANGFRRVLESIFGRILPNDPLSLVIAYLSIPAHATMPAFWQEGCAQWAETVYAPAGSPWGGRGRDSLTHMIWRLDVAADALPQPGDWRLTWQEWPFGTRVYSYGIAYLRWLDAAYGQRASVWKMIESEEERWPFLFNGGVERPTGADHTDLITLASAALEREQRAQIALLKQQPLTVTTRLNGPDSRVAAPAWTADGRLFAAVHGPHDDGAYRIVDAAGNSTGTGFSAYGAGNARGLEDGTLVWSELPVATSPWRRSRLVIALPDGHAARLAGERLLAPDIAPGAATASPGARTFTVAAIHLLPAGSQELVIGDASAEDGWLGASGTTSAWRVLPTTGLPWSPAFRPRGGAAPTEIAWVETDEAGSRLLLAPLADPGKRRVLLTVPARIFHPAWSRDGRFLFLCSDRSGVANAYRLDPDAPDQLVPVTNTLGGIIACVPSPDGKELAVIDHDRRGPYLARLPGDPATWAKAVPAIALAWPAPLAGTAEAPAPAPVARHLPDDRGDAAALVAKAYDGLSEIRPLFWTPTTLAVPEGGYGVIGMAADPLFTHQLFASAGVGPRAGSPVGLAAWSYSGWPLEVAALGWQAERTFDNRVIDSTGQQFDYVERRSSAEVRVGHGLAGMARRYQAYVSAGISEWHGVHGIDKALDGHTLLNLPAFSGVERYVEGTLAYADNLFFPAGFTSTDGTSAALVYRHSGLGGDLEGNRLIGRASYALDVWPALGQQLVLGGAAGWSDGQRYLQGQFDVGGDAATGLPRGYPLTQASGPYLLAGSASYRAPVWRPFTGFSTSPFVLRQVVLEGFYEGGKISDDHVGGDGKWFHSTGAELHADLVFWEAILNPGLGVAKQLDGEKNVVTYFQLDFLW
jgi:hypothetical protein